MSRVSQWSDEHQRIYHVFAQLLPDGEELNTIYSNIQNTSTGHIERLKYYSHYGAQIVDGLGNNAESQLLDFLLHPKDHRVIWDHQDPETHTQFKIEHIASVLTGVYFEENPSQSSANAILGRLRNILEMPLESIEFERTYGRLEEEYATFYYFPKAKHCLKLLQKHYTFQGVKRAMFDIFQGKYNIELTVGDSSYSRVENTNNKLIGKEKETFCQFFKQLHHEEPIDCDWFKRVLTLYPGYFRKDWYLDCNRYKEENSENVEQELLQVYSDYTRKFLLELVEQLPDSAALMYKLVRFLCLSGIDWIVCGLNTLVKHQFKAKDLKWSSGDLGSCLEELVTCHGLLHGETDEQLIQALSLFKEKELLLALPYAGYARKHILLALGWEDILPLQQLIFELGDSSPDSPYAPSDIQNTGCENSGVVDRAAIEAMTKNIDHKRANKYIKAIRSSSLNIKGYLTLVCAVMGLEKSKIEKQLVRHTQNAIKAYGLFAVENEEELRQRYLKFKAMYKEATQYGSERQYNTQAAVKAGLKNLAQTAGYPDDIRLEWTMEADIAEHMLPLNQHFDVEDWQIQLVLEGITPRIQVFKQDKRLKSVPPKVRKSERYNEMREAQDTIRTQASRFRQTLEDMMWQAEAISIEKLSIMSRLPVVSAMLSQLILKSGDNFGLFNGSTDSLTDVDGNKVPVKGYPVITHVYHLYKADKLVQWQKAIVDRRIVQPFKQAFRELYLVTSAEQKAETHSARFAGHEVDGAIASRLFQSRQWNLESSDEAQVYKGFAKYQYYAEVGFENVGHFLSETPSVTIDKIWFQKGRDVIALDTVDPLVFSEVMRDVDLVASVAQTGNNGETWSKETTQRRIELVTNLMNVLNLQQVTCEGHHAFIKGKLANYRVHLGSGVIHIQPGNYLCIIPDMYQESKKDNDLYLPFADVDKRMAEVVSKIFLLASDDKIKDDTILEQIRRPDVLST